VTEHKAQPPVSQAISIVKMANSPDDPLYEELMDVHQETIEEQVKLRADVAYLRKFKETMKKKKACDEPLEGDYSKTGCFDDQRAKCGCLFENIGEGQSFRDYADNLQ